MIICVVNMYVSILGCLNVLGEELGVAGLLQKPKILVFIGLDDLTKRVVVQQTVMLAQ